MSITITKTNKKHILTEEDLRHSQIYEGSDGDLYVGVDIDYYPDLCAVGIDNGAFITRSRDGTTITFCEVTAHIDYQIK